jgi:hypothetical protein
LADGPTRHIQHDRLSQPIPTPQRVVHLFVSHAIVSTVRSDSSNVHGRLLHDSMCLLYSTTWFCSGPLFRHRYTVIRSASCQNGPDHSWIKWRGQQRVQTALEPCVAVKTDRYFIRAYL